MKKNTTYELDMTTGALLPKMLRFSLPLMASSLLQLLFNAADVAVVGKFAGDNSLAAVGSTSSLINLMTNLFLGLSIGANVLSAKYIGAGDKERTGKVVHTAITVSVLSGLILTLIGVIFAPQILMLMKSPEGVIDLASLYLRVYFLGMPAMMLYNFGSSLLRSKGDTKRPLYYLSAAGVLNVVLNLVFVIVFHMDVAGVALATIISQYLSAAMILRCLMKEEDEAFRVSLNKLKIDKTTLRHLIKIGVPAGLQGVVFSLSNVVIQSSVNGFGEIVVAGSSAAASIEGFVWVSMNAFHQAALTFTSQNIGAKKYSRINRIMFCAQGCTIFAGLVFGNLAYLFGEPLLHIYTDTPASIEAGLERLSIICTTYCLCGMMDAIVGSIRGMGYGVTPTIVSMLGACGLRLLWIATIFQIPQYHTPRVLFFSYPVSWALTVLAHLICYLIMRRKFPKQDEITEVA
ncbi:MAG: MATE family efflux transporter [Lachnospiraceae bacterium]|nr:MATE family efflux transporter [Lachnospiraceae bacterium]